MVKIISAFTMLLFTCISCGLFVNQLYEPLTLQKKSYKDSKLKLNGYYYTVQNNIIHDVSFLYRDGVFYCCGGYENSSEISEINKYIDREFIQNNSYQKRSTHWGVFQIKGDSILIEKWSPHDGPEKAYAESGIIKNDTTFIITEFFKYKKGKKTGVVVAKNKITYHFKEYMPKPDSTNIFVK